MGYKQEDSEDGAHPCSADQQTQNSSSESHHPKQTKQRHKDADRHRIDKRAISDRPAPKPANVPRTWNVRNELIMEESEQRCIVSNAQECGGQHVQVGYSRRSRKLISKSTARLPRRHLILITLRNQDPQDGTADPSPIPRKIWSTILSSPNLNTPSHTACVPSQCTRRIG